MYLEKIQKRIGLTDKASTWNEWKPKLTAILSLQEMRDLGEDPF